MTLFLSLKKCKGSEEVINNGHVRMNNLLLNPLCWLLLLICILNVGSLQGSVLSILSTLTLNDVTLTALVVVTINMLVIPTQIYNPIYNTS